MPTWGDGNFRDWGPGSMRSSKPLQTTSIEEVPKVSLLNSRANPISAPIESRSGGGSDSGGISTSPTDFGGGTGDNTSTGEATTTLAENLRTGKQALGLTALAGQGAGILGENPDLYNVSSLLGQGAGLLGAAYTATQGRPVEALVQTAAVLEPAVGMAYGAYKAGEAIYGSWKDGAIGDVLDTRTYEPTRDALEDSGSSYDFGKNWAASQAVEEELTSQGLFVDELGFADTAIDYNPAPTFGEQVMSDLNSGKLSSPPPNMTVEQKASFNAARASNYASREEAFQANPLGYSSLSDYEVAVAHAKQLGETFDPTAQIRANEARSILDEKLAKEKKAVEEAKAAEAARVEALNVKQFGGQLDSGGDYSAGRTGSGPDYAGSFGDFGWGGTSDTDGGSFNV